MTKQLVWTATEEGVGDGTLEKDSAQTLPALNVPHLNDKNSLQLLNNDTSITLNVLERNRIIKPKPWIYGSVHFLCKNDDREY